MVDENAPASRSSGAAGLAVAEMAEATGVTGHTLRYYERAGLIHPIVRTQGNQRRYQPSDIEWVRFLRRLRETGMPIARMREYAALRAQGEDVARAGLDLLAEHLQSLREQIRHLRAHERALATAITDHQHQATSTDHD
ncbi:MAG: MerR family transcriptional regulator [Brevibacterium aurantiacum]|uniref:MerR family transcriptional regulator n=1 Tax=Brevibacterium aurantiacum TaxID=273384 RepID=A0A3Q9NTM2_BREAU|nr:MerR family transcriptional regulator [Brevibacterium aurantiacum]AZT94757.1 MerR family transcriptional regulator [Brevibacterium aurantiacum]